MKSVKGGGKSLVDKIFVTLPDKSVIVDKNIFWCVESVWDFRITMSGNAHKRALALCTKTFDKRPISPAA